MRGAHGSERKNCLSRSGVHKPLPIEHANSRDEAIQEELGDFGNCQDRAFPRMGKGCRIGAKPAFGQIFRNRDQDFFS